MKRKCVLLFVLLTVMTISLPAATMTFTADLSGPAEAPPNTSPGTGWTFVTFDTDAHTMRIQAVFSGLEGTTTASHIHIRIPPSPAGGVVTTVPSFPGFPLGVREGVFDMTYNTLAASTYNPMFLNNPVNMGNTAIAEASLIAGVVAGDAYLNIHSSIYGGGEIRGFLEEVPEPATFALAGGALAAFAILRRRLQA